MSTYNTKFGKLARYAPYLVSTEAARVQRFVNGVSWSSMQCNSPTVNVLTYYEAVDLARKIENKGRAERATYNVRKKA